MGNTRRPNHFAGPVVDGVPVGCLIAHYGSGHSTKKTNSKKRKILSEIEVDNDFARAASNLRANSEGRVFDILSPALRKYAQANNGQFPAELPQLKPYFQSPIDDAILQRYEIVPASSLVSELQPGGDWVITQTAPVNPALDLRSAYDLTHGRMADERVTNRWTPVH